MSEHTVLCQRADTNDYFYSHCEADDFDLAASGLALAVVNGVQHDDLIKEELREELKDMASEVEEEIDNLTLGDVSDLNSFHVIAWFDGHIGVTFP